ncbi:MULTISPECIES: hypothetical protein [unclassified Adlercreutzia]|uniref:hypothetical protein n=1 Tax=unclassified Adlercreutzia TaxID=2636013 RepID=UPI0013EA7B1A|nr:MULTISPECIES: hypothetical protein [unclassified Adlercreutzia]
MSVIKSYDVGNGDMFCILHNSDNFTTIDCNLVDDRVDELIDEVRHLSRSKTITRFISTHPDEDHIHGLETLDESIGILNFYRVDNRVAKSVETSSFKRYKELRGDPMRSFAIFKGCKRRWMNQSDGDRGSSGLNILWPDTSNSDYKSALSIAANGGSCNNVSPIIKYSLQDGVVALWMGDLETGFMEKVVDCVDLSHADILFAPHHGRRSGRPPRAWLEKISPGVIVVGDAPSDDLYYYRGYNTITQNSSGDILFDCGTGKVDVFVSSATYDASFLHYDTHGSYDGMRYVGSFATRDGS